MTACRVFVATPLRPDLVERIRAAYPGVEVVVDQDLLPPQRYRGDHAGSADFARSDDAEQRFWALARDCDVLYGIPEDGSAGLLRAVEDNERLRWAQLMASGGGATVVAADLPAGARERIRFTTAAGVHASQLAEFAIMGVLMGLKKMPYLARLQRDHDWPKVHTANRGAVGATVLVLGLGAIGAEVARLAAALNMNVIGVARTPRPVEHVDRVVSLDDVSEVLSEADAIVVALPGTKTTVGLIGADFLRRAKDGVTLVNVGRGPVVDEAALVEAAGSGKVGCAVLDVTEVEPLPPTSPLWDLDNVYLSPHSAALDDHEDDRICDLFLENLGRYLRDEPLANLIDIDAGY